MKTENMKLLDLQTGKYLELGEEGFFYGGKCIILMDTLKKEIEESFIIAMAWMISIGIISLPILKFCNDL